MKKFIKPLVLSAIVTAVSIVLECITKKVLPIPIEKPMVDNMLIALFSSLIVLGLFGGTTIQIANKSCDGMFGYKGNYIVYNIPLIYNFLSLGNIIVLQTLLIVPGLIFFILECISGLFVIFILSLILIIFSIITSIKILSDHKFVVKKVSIFFDKLIKKKIKECGIEKVKTAQVDKKQKAAEDKKGDKQQKARKELANIYEEFAKDFIDYVYGKKEGEKDFLYAAYWQQYTNLLQNDYLPIIYMMERIIYNKINENINEEHNIEIFEKILLNNSIIPLLERKGNVSLSSLDLLLRKTQKNIDKMYYLGKDYYSLYEKVGEKVNQKRLISFNKNLFIVAYKNDNIGFIMEQFISEANTHEGVELLCFMVKVLTENADERLLQILRMIKFNIFIPRQDIAIDLAIYFYYYCNNVTVPEFTRTSIKNFLKLGIFNDLSFFEYFQQISLSGIKFKSNIGDMEYRSKRLNNVVYTVALSDNTVAMYKLFVALSKNVSNLDFSNLNYNTCLSLREMFNNDGSLKDFLKEECGKFIGFHGLPNNFASEKDLFNKVNDAYWEKEKQHTEDLAEPFFKNIFPELQSEYLSEESDAIKISNKFLINNNRDIAKVRNEMTNKFQGKVILSVEQFSIAHIKLCLPNYNNESEIDLPTTNGIQLMVNIDEAINYLASKYVVVDCKQPVNVKIE